MNQIGKHYILIGNPGVGKSTTLNSYIGKYYFESGVSFGSGITKLCRTIEYNKCMYTDTPGISDVEYEKQAINEVNKIMSVGGNFIIIFVITLEAGKPRRCDLNIIKSFINSINRNDITYNIMINKLDEIIYKILQESKIEILKNNIIREVKYDKFKFILNKYYDILSSRNNATYMDNNIRFELDNLSSFNIAPSNVIINPMSNIINLEEKKRQAAEKYIEIMLLTRIEEIKRGKLEQNSDSCEFRKSSICILPKCSSKEFEKVSKNVVYKYCDRHKCDRNDCPKEIYLNYIMCYIHKCVVDSCMDSTDKGNICRYHTCSDCESKVYNVSKYCTNHMCKRDGCTDAKNGINYCTDHRCKTCGNKTLFGNYCNTHRCSLKGCKLCRSSHSSYCDEHLTKEDRETSKKECYKCNITIYGYDDYCPLHLCKVCYEKIDRSYGSCCDIHGCDEYNCNNNSYENKYCLTHKCANGSCDNRIVDNSRYCLEHKCGICNNGKLRENIACHDHLCLYSYCNNYRINNKEYCTKHKCANLTCRNGVPSLKYCDDCYNELLTSYMEQF